MKIDMTIRGNAVFLLLGLLAGWGLSATAGAPHAAGTDCQALARSCVREIVAAVADRGWLGFELTRLESTQGQPEITRLHQNSPAQAAGLEVGDRLVAIAGYELTQEGDFRVTGRKLQEVFQTLRPGEAISLGIVRQGQPLTLEVVPAGYDDYYVLAEYVGRQIIALAPEVASSVLPPPPRPSRRPAPAAH